MNHKLVVAAVATAVLAAGGSTIALADDDAPSGTPAAALRAGTGADDRDDRNDRDGRDDDRRELRGAKVTLQKAVDAALKAVPGTAESAELDDDGGRAVWDVDVLGDDGKWHEVRVDAVSAAVLDRNADRDGDTDDRSGQDDRDDRDDRGDADGGNDRDDRDGDADDRRGDD